MRLLLQVCVRVHELLCENPFEVVPILGAILRPGDTGHCLGTSVVVTVGDATGIEWVGVRDGPPQRMS